MDDITHLTHEVVKAHPGEFLDYVLARPSHPGVRAMIDALGETRDAREVVETRDAVSATVRQFVADDA